MDGGLSDDTHRVLSDDVKRRKNPVPPLLPQRLQQRLSRLIRRVCRHLFFLQLHLTTNSCDTVEELASERDGRLPDPPYGVQHALLQLRQQEVDGLVGVVRDDHLACAHGRLAHIL